MLRGITTFVCDDCGQKFKGMDCEWGATIYTYPVRCPNCGSMHTCPPGFLNLNKNIYRKLWKSLDESNQGEIKEP